MENFWCNQNWWRICFPDKLYRRCTRSASVIFKSHINYVWPIYSFGNDCERNSDIKIDWTFSRRTCLTHFNVRDTTNESESALLCPLPHCTFDWEAMNGRVIEVGTSERRQSNTIIRWKINICETNRMRFETHTTTFWWNSSFGYCWWRPATTTTTAVQVKKSVEHSISIDHSFAAQTRWNLFPFSAVKWRVDFFY